ncbi:hypothetical protein [Ferrimonas balearica]|uniref:hypothetical protein n=1 Tax=Ferrimonas balearica TaxID=44012 RepID=UPI001C997AB3|nr:hypothetical protein [Ferrimonas balearica]MBY5993561.1 hypothetical protein [Ferrimonas balearica]
MNGTAKTPLLIALLMLAPQVQAEEQLVKHARNAGITACLSTIADLEQFFGAGNNYGSWSTWASDKADDQIFNSAMEITFSDGVHLIDLTVAPTKDGHCSYAYTRTWSAEQNCMAVSRQDFMKGASYKTELNANVAAFEDGTARLFLMPSGNSCVLQKKEVGIRHKRQGE